MSQVRMRLKDDETKERDSLLKDNIKSQNDHSGIKEKGLCLNRQSVILVVLAVVCVAEGVSLIVMCSRQTEGQESKLKSKPLTAVQVGPPTESEIGSYKIDNSETTKDDGVKVNRMADQASMESEVRSRFPGYFRTKSEQRAVERMFENKSDRMEMMDVDTKSGFFHQNGCCKTQGVFKTPEEGYTFLGEKKTILQFGNSKQHFYNEVSENVKQCVNCRCRCIALPIWVSAIYLNASGSPDIQFFNLSSVTKCLT